MLKLTLEEPRALERAIETLQHGGVVAFPTDTVYGIGASLTHPDALDRIFSIKGRDPSQVIPVLLASSADVAKVTTGASEDVLALAAAFWPGPLTVALPARDHLPPQVVNSDGTVGVRVPNHSVALMLAQRNGGAIAATSANLSGAPPALRVSDLAESLTEELDLVLDGGFSRGGLASTVVGVNGDTINVIREGAIPAAEVLSVWEQIRSESTTRVASAPGM